MIRNSLLFSLIACSAFVPVAVSAAPAERSVSAPTVSALCGVRAYERRTQGGTLSPRQRERCKLAGTRTQR
ncbi:hypothetical protein KRR38_14140 [Novosphingobium sp. G106]|uniref:hypothetical protein n=1 Tax=Novosphingobium sp. G106 TaxID=2849500 RepID=UPI001C2D5C4B|nr:hypothetical protein [Novosphingobium sp. G106]MBV1688783.1 hypothetical protein [Novosphingobium sp. G106]